MRHVVVSIAVSLLTLMLATSVALAQDWGLNQIVGFVNMAERRFNEGDVRSARFNLDRAREMLPNASAAAKADKGYVEVQERIARLDKVIAGKEAGAATAAQADEKFREAGSVETNAKFSTGYDDYEEAVGHYKRCTALLEESAAIDPSIKQREEKFAELSTRCKEGAEKMAKKASGDGKNAAETEHGKAALEAYALAVKTAKAKKLQALELVEGLKAAKECNHNAHHLTMIRLRNGKPMWDENTTKLGGMSLKAMYEACAKMEVAIQAKPAFGCGVHHAAVSQHRATIYDKWGSVQASRKEPFEAVDCSKMPKKSVFPGLSARFAGIYAGACGKDAIYIISHDSWVEQPRDRFMAGQCWKKGNLNFNR